MANTKEIISIARKAGYVIIGKDNLVSHNKKLYLILLDNTAGNSLNREMRFLADNRKIELIKVSNLAELVSIENCKVIGIKNKNISDKIIEYLKGE